MEIHVNSVKFKHEILRQLQISTALCSYANCYHRFIVLIREIGSQIALDVWSILILLKFLHDGPCDKDELWVDVDVINHLTYLTYQL